jgi:hypothetical protein
MGKGRRLPSSWNSRRFRLLDLIGLLIVLTVAPFILLAFICVSVFKRTNPSAE